MINCRVTSEDLQSLLEQRRCLDRRRLEEGFLLYAALQTMSKYDLWLKIAFIPNDRNEMAELFTNSLKIASNLNGEVRRSPIWNDSLMYPNNGLFLIFSHQLIETLFHDKLHLTKKCSLLEPCITITNHTSWKAVHI